MTTSLDTYFWMMDRLEMADDPRNKVNKAQNSVTFAKPFLKKIENGHYMSLLMKQMQQTFESRTGKQLAKYGIQIPAEANSWDSNNWQQLFKSLEHYGIVLTKQKQDIIVKTQNIETVFDVFEALFDVDNNPQGRLSDASKRKLEIKQFKTPMKQRLSSAVSAQFDERALSVPSSAKIFGGNRNGSIGQQSPMRLQPLSSDRLSQQTPKTLDKRRPGPGGPGQASPTAGPSLASLRKSSPENQSLSIPKTQLLQDHLEDALPKTLDSARTSVQLVLMSLAMGFDMKPKQAAALLSNNSKFLAIMCVKGQKGVGFDNVRRWYEIVYSAVPHLVHLIATEKQDVLSYGSPLTKGIGSQGGQQKENRGKILYKTLNILKSGFYSRDPEVQLQCGMVFSDISREIQRLNNEMVGDAWDWFVSSANNSEFKRAPTLPASPSKKGKGKGEGLASDTVDQEIERYQFETGLQAVHFAYVTNNDFLQYGVELILNFGRANPVELFTQRMQQVLPKWSYYAQLSLDVFLASQGQQLAVMMIDQSGVLKYWLNTSIQVADSNNQYDLQDKIVALVFLTEIWLHRSDFVESFMPGASDAIMKILRKASRDMSKNLTYVSIELMFRLLERFSAERHNFAPSVYKTLTFLLVEFYVETDVRELMLTHFTDVIRDYDTVPINTLMEPLLRQIETNQYTIGMFNNFDFEFFRFVVNYRGLEVPTAMQLMDALVKISMSSVLYQKISVELVLTIMNRYGHCNETLEFWRESIKQIMQTLVNITARFTIHRHHLRNEQNNFFNRLALKNQKTNKKDDAGRMNEYEFIQIKLNERLIVNLLAQVISAQNQLVNQVIKDQLTDSYIAIQQQMNTESKAIYFLLKYYSPKVDQMVDQRMAMNPQAASNVPIPYAEELKQLEHMNGGSFQPGTIDLYKQSSPNKNHMELKRQRSQVTVAQQQLSPMIGQTSVALPLNTPGQKRQKEIPQHIYEYDKWEEDWEKAQYQSLLKKHNRLFKEIHKQYAFDGAKKPNAVEKPTFEDNKSRIEQIGSVQLIKMLRDFKLENGLSHQYLKQEVNTLVRYINTHILKEPDSILDLSFQGFENFLLQWAHQLFGPNLKSFQLMDKLINKMREHENFKKYGLTVKQNETTARKGVEILEKLGQQIIPGDAKKQKQFEAPEGLTVKKETERVVEYTVHPIIAQRIKPSRRIVTEVLDQILFDKFGFHFLEPVVTERVTHKLVPQNIARQKHHIEKRIDFKKDESKFKGRPDNSPLSHGNELSAEQALKFQEFKKQLRDKQKERDEAKKPKGPTSLIGKIGAFFGQKVNAAVEEVDRDNKDAFRAQAYNRKATQSGFTDNMQLAIFQAAPSKKKTMFEVAEVLNEVIKAVEKGKTNLKLEHVPYRLYQARKHSVQANRTNALSEDLPKKKPLSPQKRKRNQERIDDFLAKHDQYLASQQEKLFKQRERAERLAEREQNRKDLHREEYEELQEELRKERDKKLKAENKQKLKEQREKEKADKDREQEIKDNMHNLKQQARAEIRIKKQEYQSKVRDEERKETRYDRQKTRMAENAKEEHQQQHSQYLKDQEKKRSLFFQWCKSGPVSTLVNQKFKKGLFVKYLYAIEISKSTTGLTREGWLQFLFNHKVSQNVDPKVLMAIFQRTLKETQEIPQADYQGYFIGSSKQEAAKPKSGELHYGGFVSAMVKVAHQYNAHKELKNPPKTLEDLAEYNLADKTGMAVRSFFEFMNVAEKKDR